MTRHPLTEFLIRSLKSEHQTLYFDRSLPCFGLRVGKKRKAWIVETRGKRITIGQWPYMTLREARQKAHVIIGSSQAQEPTPKRVSEVITDYFKYHEKKTRESTAKARYRLLTRHFLPDHNDKRLDAITKAHISTTLNKLLGTPAEALNAHMAMLAFFNWCVQQEHIIRNPMVGMPKPAKPSSRERVLTPDELAQILRTAIKLNTPYSKFIILIFHTGLRKSEAHN
jgi:hypothetical protein